MKFPFCICLFPLVFALFHPALAEGNNGSLDFEQRINGKAVLKTIEPIRERLQDLSAVFFSGHDVVIYGIVLSPDGYIATKASELHSYRDLTIRVGSSKYGQFREIGSDPSTDIAVVKVEAAGLHAPGPVSNDAAMGTLVVSNGSTTRTSRRPQLGTLSAEQRPIPNGDTAYLGVVFGTPCTIQEVTKDGPAAQAGAKAGDEILAVDGTPVTALDAVSPILSRKKVGERVTLEVKRKDKRLSYTITLGSRRQALGGNAPEDSNDLISGGFSKRRDDFPMVLQHDTPSRYTLMGGPLLNLKGELIGMNIAQSEPGGKLRPAHQRCAEKRAKHPEKRAPAGKIAQENTGTFYFPGTEEAVRLPFLFPCVAHPAKQDGFTCREHQRHPAPSWVSR